MSDSQAKTIILVLGMHRSGTSAVAGAMQAAGAELGDNLMPAKPDNPKGFWEDQDIYHLNERLLYALDLDWDMPSILPPENLTNVSLDELHAEAQALLEKKLSESNIIAIKDPRICLLLSFWLDIADRMGLHIRFAVVVRNPLDVAQSLATRNGFQKDKSFALWFCHNFLIVRTLRERHDPRIVVNYDDFLKSPYEIIDRLAAFVKGVKSDEYESEQLKIFVDGFIDPSIRHSEHSLSDLLQDKTATDELVFLYKYLLHSASGEWSNHEASVVLDMIDPLKLEARNYSIQRHTFKSRYETFLQENKIQENKLEKMHLQLEMREIIVKKEYSELQTTNERLTEEYSELQTVHERLSDEYSVLQNVNSQLLQENTELKERVDREIPELIQSNREIERHLQGAIQTISDIKQSLSFRLGMVLTWPARKVFDKLIKPFIDYPENRTYIKHLLWYGLTHPIQSLRLLSVKRLINAYITFFKNPDNAGQVTYHYSRLLGGSSVTSELIYSKNNIQLNSPIQSAHYTHRKVSLITVNYNGRQHLDHLLTSLYAQDYDDFEIILVDNGSADGSADLMRERYPDVKLIELSDNLGFAEANNIAMEVADGRYLCLVNNDTRAAPDWLSKMVAVIENNPAVGAVGPKILFWEKFVQIEVSCSSETGKRNIEALLDITHLRQALPIYTKVFYESGWQKEQTQDRVIVRSFIGKSRLRVPVCAGQTRIKLKIKLLSDTRGFADFSAPGILKTSTANISAEQWTELELNFDDKLNHPGLHYIINNAASHVNERGDTIDRGFGMPDDGMFDQTEKVSALCGCAMLIRPEALQGKPIFSNHFFAYFEDTDLSLRIREAGYDLIYCPESVLYHKHASTSTENSAFFRYYVNRNRQLFLALHYKDELWQKRLVAAKNELNHLKNYFEKNACTDVDIQFARRIPQILEDWDRLIPQIKQGRFFDRNEHFPKLALYNSFWNTLGGGEHHGCVIAEALQTLGPVDLVSERDFSLAELEERFKVNLKYCRKRIVSAEELHHNPRITADYDVFVNSTYSSDLQSNSSLSYYVVSFPFRLENRDQNANKFIKHYKRFLANSRFTAGWVKKWWGVSADVLYPSIEFADFDFDAVAKKEKKIVHVGRFFRKGHNKKQLEIVQAFTSLQAQGRLDDEWKLVLVGRVHKDQAGYFQEVRNAAADYPVKIHLDLSLTKLRSLYQSAAIYIHATGLGENLDQHPELSEHFGITTVEAMSYGCVPVVIDGGGQPEIVQHGTNGYLFNDYRGLMDSIAECAKLFDQNPDRFTQLSEKAFHDSRKFSRKATRNGFINMLKSDSSLVEKDYSLS